MEKKNVRIKDIATKAKVSAGTVDRVLHNRGNVSVKAREKILKIIDEMSYEPNLVARALRSNKAYRIAALIPDFNIDAYWLGPKLGIERAEKDMKQYKVSVRQYSFNPYDAESFIKAATAVSESAPDGILIAPIFYREVLPFFEMWKAQNIPFVLVNTQIAEFSPLSYIGQDSYKSGLLAAKILHFGQPFPGSILIVHIDEDISNAAHLLKKERGFRNYFSQNSLEQYTIIKLVLNRKDPASFTKELDSVIENTPDLASIYVTTSKSHEVAKYLEQRFIKNIKIVGYDLVPQNIYYLNKNIIHFLINQNPKGQGYWGIMQLTDFLVFDREVSEVKYLQLDVVTKENLDYFTGEETTYIQI